MQPINLQKTVAGALLVGASLLSGNATLLAVAGGVGVNWTSEGLAGLWQGAMGPRLSPGSPLARAHERALRRAVATLREQYRQQVDGRNDGRAFALLEACATAIAQAQAPAGVASVEGARQALQQSLPALLWGHDARQVAWLQPRLLDEVARAFQDELVRDDAAWRAFHGWLIQGTGQQVAALSQSLQAVPAVMAQLQQPDTVLAALASHTDRLAARLDALHDDVRRLAEQPPPPSPSPPSVFNNPNMQAGTANQVAGSQYINSPHAEGAGSQATVTLRGGPEAMAFTPIASTPRRLLALFASGHDLAPLDLKPEARALHDSVAARPDRFHLTLLPASRVEDFSRGLMAHRPHLLHFSGHGTAGGLLFEVAGGMSQPVSWQALADELRGHAPPLRCVFLNSCDSASHADAARLPVPFVIAMRGAPDDDAATTFTEAFYGALALGYDVPFAFDRARNRLRLKGLGQGVEPVLVSADDRSG